MRPAPSILGALFFTNLSLIANSASDISQTIINLPGEIIAVADPSRREERLERRINVLLMGNDARPDEDPRLVRTDTMMIVTIDPVNGTGTMLSIPRDLWVPIPVGTGASREVVEGRINEAYRTGHLRDYPGGGGALAMRTVEYNLGVPIDHYAMIDFSGFEKMVETVGGIEVDIPYEIVDYLYPTLDYGTTVIRFAPGPQNLNGLRALQYARTPPSGRRFRPNRPATTGPAGAARQGASARHAAPNSPNWRRGSPTASKPTSPSRICS